MRQPVVSLLSVSRRLSASSNIVKTLRVLTFNIHKGIAPLNRSLILEQIRQAIRDVGADLVFLQEVIGANERHAKKFDQWPDQTHYEFLADQIWSDYAYGQNAVYPAGHHGNAILSKFPILLSEQRDVSASRLEQRGILYAQVALPGASAVLHCVNVHFGLRERWRRKQLTQLKNFLAERVSPEQPLIVAGDFNDWSRRLHHRFAANDAVVEVFQAQHGRLARTFPRRLPVFALDRIYVRNLEPLNAVAHRQGIWSMLSDHVGLSAELGLKPEAA